MERVILRCLEKDPVRRPASALQVSAGLPGGDPLAAALAAGETPSPEMVAAAGESSGLAPRVALACLAASLAGLVIAVLFADRLSLTGRVPLDESPETLAVKAQEIATRSGYAARPFDRASGFSSNTEYFDYIRKNDRSKTRWSNMEAGRPPGITFWYRTSPRELALVDAFLRLEVHQDDPPRDVSGMVLVVLDTKGRLLEFEAVPPQTDPKGSAPAPDWGPLIAATGARDGGAQAGGAGVGSRRLRRHSCRVDRRFPRAPEDPDPHRSGRLPRQADRVSDRVAVDDTDAREGNRKESG